MNDPAAFPDEEVAIAMGVGIAHTNPFQNSQARDGEGCQCSRCINWGIARRLFLPAEVSDELREFGLLLEQFAGHTAEKGRTPAGLYRSTRFYLLPGARVEGGRPLRRPVGRWHWLEVGPLSKDDGYGETGYPSGTIVLRVSTVLPYFASALTEFEQDNSTACPHCGSTWMSSGRVRCSHRIAKWFKVSPSVARKGQIFRLCWDCLKPSFFPGNGRPGRVLR